MKRWVWLLALPLLACATPAYAYGGASITVSSFEPALSPYGEWIWVDGVGRVWRPYEQVVGDGFEPYQTGGHWVYTDEGWMFESDWDWGWAPFHYGRWHLAPRYGWVWYPDTVWAPAWVEWRHGGGYVGWMPLPPPGITISFSSYRPGWCFVEERYLVQRDFHRYRLHRDRAEGIFSRTNNVHHASFGSVRRPVGPPVGHVASAAGREIRPMAIRAPAPGEVRRISTRDGHGGPPGGVAGQGGSPRTFERGGPGRPDRGGPDHDGPGRGGPGPFGSRVNPNAPQPMERGEPGGGPRTFERGGPGRPDGDDDQGPGRGGNRPFGSVGSPQPMERGEPGGPRTFERGGDDDGQGRGKPRPHSGQENPGSAPPTFDRGGPSAPRQGPSSFGGGAPRAVERPSAPAGPGPGFQRGGPSGGAPRPSGPAHGGSPGGRPPPGKAGPRSK